MRLTKTIIVVHSNNCHGRNFNGGNIKSMTPGTIARDHHKKSSQINSTAP